MKTKPNDHAGDVIAVFRLSTGYKVEITLGGVIDKDMAHLTQALIGEVAFSSAKEHGCWEKGLESLVSEVADCVLRLSEQEKNSLLRAIVFQFVCKKWSEMERKLRHK